MSNQKRRGFTLIELLAVVVVLAIILAIAVPSISSVIYKSKKSAFESDAKMVLTAIKYKKLENESFDETTVNKDSINTLLGLSSANYSSLSVSKEDKDLTIMIVGLGKWDGLVACGTEHAIDIVNSIRECGTDKTKPVITLNGSSPLAVNLNSTYTDAGATALDNMDGDLTSSIVTSGSVNTAVEGTYTITYTVSDVAGNTATSTRTVEVFKTIYEYSYTGSYQSFTAAKAGTYKIELWGAEGGYGSSTWLYGQNTSGGIFRGGRGAYTSGDIYLTPGETVYIYIGGKGADHVKSNNVTVAGGYNGGGTGAYDTVDNNGYGGGGGGATDIRLTSGTWNDTTSLRSRIMVAAGGGGGAVVGQYYTYGDTERCGTATMGGALSINGTINRFYGNVMIPINNVTQTSGYQFGVGAPGVNGGEPGGGGGGGYYGGTAYDNSGGNMAGAGGSSFISGCTGCNAIDSSGVHTNQSEHYSGKMFTGTVMDDGNTSMPTYDGTSTMVGNNGNGYAKITYATVGAVPRITILGDLTMNIFAGTTYSDAGATANDPLEGDLTSKIVTTSNVNPSVAGTYTVTYSVTDSDNNTVTKVRTINVVDSFNYSYTGNYQTFTPLTSGTYKLELWGAEGGYGSTTWASGQNTSGGIFRGGRGSYTSGNIYIASGETIYIYVGGKGADHVKSNNVTVAGGYNGGGTGAYDTADTNGFGGGGGGATDVRLTSGTWNDTTSLRSRIMVAAGGGGGTIISNYYTYGDTNRCGIATMGGAISINNTINRFSGNTMVTINNVTQTSGYQFGIGAPGVVGDEPGGGAGGGYYGGSYYSNGGHNMAGAGGSSFISGYTGCNAIDATGTHTGQANHYSGKVFTNMTMASGNDSMPTYDGTSTMVGNNGNGYAKIKYLGD